MMINGITIFGHEIPWYSILGFCGLVAACAMCYARRKRFDVGQDDILNLAGYALIGGIVGAKLLALLCVAPSIIKYWDDIVWNAEFIRLLMSTGFVFYGGLIGVIVMFYIYCKQFKVSFANIMDLAAPAVPLFHVFGRIGCYVTGCCGGINGFPLQLVEAFLNLCICIGIVAVQNKSRCRGRGFIIYLLSYGTVRFFLEFFRGDPERGFIGPLSISQWISIVLVTIALVFWRKRRKNIN